MNQWWNIVYRITRTNISKSWIKKQKFSFKKMHLKMSSAKWWTSHLSFDALRKSVIFIYMYCQIYLTTILFLHALMLARKVISWCVILFVKISNCDIIIWKRRIEKSTSFKFIESDINIFWIREPCGMGSWLGGVILILWVGWWIAWQLLIDFSQKREITITHWFLTKYK